LKDFFSDGSPFLSHPLLTAERTRREIDFLVDSLALAPVARVLDVGCGFGRHSIELGRRGYRALGIDPATAMIEAARAQAVEAGVDVAFRQIAGEDFADAQPFDAAISLLTTLGQVAANSLEDNRRLLTAVAKSLKADGLFALELPQKQPALAALKPADRFGNEATYTQVQRSYDAGTDIVTEQFRLVTPSGAQAYHLRYRLFSQEDVTCLLTAAGLRIVNKYAGYTCAELTDDSPFMLFICARCL
jgi:SAM-dependent methyltransferase